MVEEFDIDESELVGDWKGKGEELYCDVDNSKIYNLGYTVNINFKKMKKDIYRIKIKYYYSKTGTIFGLKYKKGELAFDGSDSSFVTRHENGFICTSLWYNKDPLSRTIETFTFDADKNLNYRYSTNQINNPLNSLLKNVSNSLMRTGKISVSGSYSLQKKD